MKTIYSGYGLAALRDHSPITKKDVISLFGPPDEEILRKKYSIQMVYLEKGLRFYYRSDDKAEDPPIITIGFLDNFEG
ncbi:MAG: hypothetical protein ACTSVZ_12870, partial [Promethearchaeota archaeon]